MNAAVAYICVPGNPASLLFLTRFAATYHSFPAGAPHRLYVVCNGDAPGAAISAAIASAGGTPIHRPENTGWDIGAYLALAKDQCRDFDVMMCLGESVYFHRAGWLERVLDSWGRFGPGIYGFWGSRVVRPHIMTTAFATSPEMLRKYPLHVDTKEQRYDFEHGKHSFWHWLRIQGQQARVVTWDGCWGPEEWRAPDNILWRGNQSNCLAWCNHTDMFAELSTATRKRWAALADAA